MSTATRMLVAMARREPGSMELLLDILPDVFPWVRFLPESDLHAFAVELVDPKRAADSVGNSASIAPMLLAWQHTAEVHSAPELLAALTRNHAEGYGSVPAPRESRLLLTHTGEVAQKGSCPAPDASTFAA